MTFVTLQSAVNGVQTEMRLSDWGIATCKRRPSNQAGDGVDLDLITRAADGPDPFAFGQQIIVRIGRAPGGNPKASPAKNQTAWGGGKVFFVGWRVENFATVSPRLESFRYKFAGPWDFFLERLPFYKLFVTYDATLGKQVARYRSQVVLGQSLNTLTGANDTVPGTLDTNLMSISQQIIEIVQFCIGRTTVKYGSPQFQFDALSQDVDGNWELSAARTNIAIPDYVPGTGAGSGGNGLAPGQTTVPLLAPLDAVQDISCAEALRREMRWIGGVGSPVAWFDYTTTAEDGVTPLPTLKISTRDLLPSRTLPAFPANANGSTALSICRRDDLIPPAIHLMYRVSTTVAGTTFTQIYDDIACAEGCTNAATGLTDEALIDKAIDFGAPAITLDFEGAIFSGVTEVTESIVTIPSPIASVTPTDYASIFPALAQYESYAIAGYAVTDPETGADLLDSLDGYSYVLRNGGVRSWMSSGGTAGSTLRVRVTITVSGGKHTSTGFLPARLEAMTTDLTLCNIPGGDYTLTSGGGVVAGEQIPWGLASYIYNIETIPQYQGSYTLQEQEVSDACPMGNNLNLSGSLPEWQTMNACVQEIEYDLVEGTTTWTFGPAQHLGAQDLVERMRVNRFPRFYFLVGGNLLNN